MPMVIFAGFIAAFVQLLAGVLGPAFLLAAACATAMFALLPRLAPETLPRVRYAIPIVLWLSSALAVLVLWLDSPRFSGIGWMAPFLSSGGAAAIEWLGLIGSKRCEICNRRIGTGVSLACPRCGLIVCDHSCWRFEELRCRLCSQNGVPIFPADARWWDRALGPRFRGGQCQLCLTARTEADLRACQRCGRPQCRSCWDDRNGQCSRCGWVLRDLPPRLSAYMTQTTASSKAELD